VALIPFATAVMAEHLKSGADEHVAAAVYAGAFVLMAVAFGVLWEYITRHRKKLGVELSDEEVRRRSIAFQIGNPIYAIAFIVAFISPAVVLVIIGALAVYYMVLGMRSPDAR
jgi:TMEM175 potassium channel family protein